MESAQISAPSSWWLLAPGQWDAAQTLRLLNRDGQVDELTMGDYLWGVVAAVWTHEGGGLC